MILLPFFVSRMNSIQSGKVRNQENFTQRKEIFIMAKHKREYDLFRRLYSSARQRASERERERCRNLSLRLCETMTCLRHENCTLKFALEKSCHRKSVEEIGRRLWESQGDGDWLGDFCGNLDWK